MKNFFFHWQSGMMENAKEVETSDFVVRRKLKDREKQICSAVKASLFCNHLLAFFSTRSQGTTYKLLSISARKSWILSSIQKETFCFLISSRCQSVCFSLEKTSIHKESFCSLCCKLAGQKFPWRSRRGEFSH